MNGVEIQEFMNGSMCVVALTHKNHAGDGDPHRALAALASLMQRYVTTLVWLWALCCVEGVVDSARVKDEKVKA